MKTRRRSPRGSKHFQGASRRHYSMTSYAWSFFQRRLSQAPNNRSAGRWSNGCGGESGSGVHLDWLQERRNEVTSDGLLYTLLTFEGCTQCSTELPC